MSVGESSSETSWLQWYGHYLAAFQYFSYNMEQRAQKNDFCRMSWSHTPIIGFLGGLGTLPFGTEHSVCKLKFTKRHLWVPPHPHFGSINFLWLYLTWREREIEWSVLYLNHRSQIHFRNKRGTDLSREKEPERGKEETVNAFMWENKALERRGEGRELHQGNLPALQVGKRQAHLFQVQEAF